MTVIGLDAEWTPQAQGSRVDVLQLAVPGIDGAKAQVFILHLCHKDMQPPNGERYDGGSGVPEGQWPLSSKRPAAHKIDEFAKEIHTNLLL